MRRLAAIVSVIAAVLLTVLAPAQYVQHARRAFREHPVITGTAYPGNTLTSTKAAPWRLNGVPIAGETGLTYAVRIDDIGGGIDQSGSNVVTVWHPRDEPGVQAVYLGNFGLGSASAPISSWPDQSGNGWALEQGAAINQPAVAVNAAGNKVARFDGVGNFMPAPSGAMGIFRNRAAGYVISSVLDRTHNGGNADHLLTLITNASGSARIQASTRRASTQNFAADGRRLTADSSVQAVSPNNGSAHVFTVFADWGNGFLRVRTDGITRSSVAYSSGPGNSQDDDSSIIVTGGTASAVYAPIDVAGLIFVGGSALEATALWRLENYLALLHGQTIAPPS